MSSLHAAAMRLFKRMYSRLASFRDSDCANPGEAHVAALLPLIAAGSSATASSSRLLIDLCIGKLRQQLVGLFLLPHVSSRRSIASFSPSGAAHVLRVL